MKVWRLKRPLRESGSKQVFDARKATSVLDALTKVSAKKTKRNKAVESLPSTKVRLNIKGNRSGMHNADNPPDSEEMRRRGAMRRLWNKQMPELQCNSCAFSAQCPQFKAGFVCAFLPFLNSHKIESEKDLIFYAKELCGENVKRAQLMLIMERLSGAKPDIDTSEALSHVFAQLMQLHERLTQSDDTTFEIESSDGTIIGRLFGGLERLLGKTKEAYANPVIPSVAAKEAELEVSSAPLKKAPNSDLIGELALLRSSSGIPILNVKPKGPVQEELSI